MEKLFTEFKPSTPEDWKQQILKDLKGAALETLVWHNPNGFEIAPFYTSSNKPANTAPVYHHSDWDICEVLLVNDEGEANAKALKALNGGASSLHFVLNGQVDLGKLLKDISIQHIELCFVLLYVDDSFKTRLHSYLDEKGISADKLNGSIRFDGIANLVRQGNWFRFAEHDLASGNSWVDAGIYQNAGATQSFELACTLAHAHEYLLHLKQARKFRFTISIGSDFFGEIAKLRALRKLWRLISHEYGTLSDIHIHAVSSELNQSNYDAYNNMLRTTTEGMSAVIGGCDSLTLGAYNKVFDRPSDFSERIARNQQLIFKNESYLDKVADMGAGSYYIEHLTDEIASRAWEEFKIIEHKGGLLACLRSNHIQDKIAQQAHHLVNDFKDQKVILVGVNKFQNNSESRPPVKTINAEMPKGIIETIKPLFLSEHLVKENA